MVLNCGGTGKKLTTEEMAKVVGSGGAGAGEEEPEVMEGAGGGNDRDGNDNNSSEPENELSVKVLERINDEELAEAEVSRDRESRNKVDNGGGDGFQNTAGTEMLGHDRDKKERSLDVQITGKEAQVTFDDLGLKPEINVGLKREQFIYPSPIQIKAIPCGKFGYDLILQSKSGTGKTCAFGTIILQHLDLTPDSMNDIQAIILAPTREIADQNKTVLKCIGSGMHGLNVKVFIGGTCVEQSKRRSKVANVVSGTPGRILHMIEENEMDLSKVKVVVLDEADRLMESSFIVDIEAILNAIPKERQTIAASATYPEGLKDFVKRYMKEPIDVTTDVSSNLLYVQLFAADVNKILNKEKKAAPVSMDDIFSKKLDVIWEILRNAQYTQAIIFSRFILQAQKIFNWLKDERLDAALLTGAQDQHARLSALRDAKEGKCKILVASDLATRGIDCEGVDLVINFEIPDDPSTFVHRFGRAGRFGSAGISITLLSFDSDRGALSDLVKGSNLTISMLEEKQQLQSLGKARIRNLPKLFIRRDQISMKASENENWKEMLHHIMKVPLCHPSATMDTFGGFKLAVEFSDIINKVDKMKDKYESL